MLMKAEGSAVARAPRWRNCPKEGKYETRITGNGNLYNPEWIIKILAQSFEARAHACVYVGVRVHARVAAHERESAEQKRACLTQLLKPEGAHKKIRRRKFQRAVHGVFFDSSHTNYDLATVSAVFWRDSDKSTVFTWTEDHQTVQHSGAHGENEGEKPWPKLVGLQRAGRILWPAYR